MGHEVVVGLIMWAVLFGWALVGFIVGPKPSVSGNGARSSTRKAGPAWEQDVPYPECFEEDDL